PPSGSPSLLQLLVSSKAPSLPPHYRTSSLLWASPTPGPGLLPQLWIPARRTGHVATPQPAGSPKFLSALSLRAVPFHPGTLHECFCLLLPHESQASSNSADWPLSLGVTRPDRVHLRYGSQVRRTRLRQKDCSCLRSLATCRIGNLQGELLSVHKIR